MYTSNIFLEPFDKGNRLAFGYDMYSEPVRGLNQLVYFLYGGLFSSMYIIAVMLIGERFRGEELVRATAAFSMMWGLGSSAGPPVVGAAMDLLPEEGLANGYVLAQAAFIAALLWMPWLLRRR